MKRILAACWIVVALFGATKEEDEMVLVRITKDIPYIYVDHKGTKIKVMRIQDPGHLLLDDYSKTSRPCPPFCIHPISVDKRIKTIATVEMIEFMRDKVNSGKGFVIDARLPHWYELETIPSAINLPFTLLEKGDKEVAKKLFKLFGMEVKADGSWDFSKAKELAIFCNGVWCDQSPRLIRQLLKYGYPADKILYYRNGMQGWKLLGLTTVVEKGKVKK
ncbi:MAG: sulfurtransferase [Nitratiruptor sp.]|nr:sulfurtransferase [Nitratiruptor sp.]NPA83201.1 rhodanese-like domain-containing protein [Campylobacterota bacterium]